MTERAAEAETETEAAAPRPVDRKLLAESALYGVPYQPYADMSPRERGAVKGRWVNSLRLEARRRRLDPDEFLAMTEDARAAARKENPEQNLPSRRRRDEADDQTLSESKAAARSFEEVMSRHIKDDPPVPQLASLYDEGLSTGDREGTHSSMDDVPATESDPRLRSTATIGDVRPTDNEDLAGWKQPRNLLDVYARYSIGDGQHFVRVERIEPKAWQSIPCAGYLGEIQNPISEEAFNAWYGGRVYSLTVYGPDPKGRRDPVTGLPVIKAKTEPFRYTVPSPYPNLAALPGNNPTKKQYGARPMMNPFGFPQGSVPATPADASMHKTNIDFLQNQLNRAEAEKKEIRREAQTAAAPNTDVLKIVSEASKEAVAQAVKAAEAREHALQEQLREERESRRALEAKVEKLVEKDQESRQNANPVKDAVHLVKEMQPGKSAEEELNRLRQAHMEETNRLREANRDTAATLKERHDDELKRLRDRLDDVEKHGKERLEEAEKRFREQEKELKERIDATRREERDVAERRVRETVERFEDRLKDLRSQHDRELRMQTEQHVTRVDTTKSTWDMQLANAKERAARLEEELEEAREEAEKSKDPVAVLKKSNEMAEALGFKKDDNGPQTAWERFAATAGMGVSKAFETIDQWLPKAMEARGQAVAQRPPGPPRQLPPGVPPQQQQPRVVRQPSKRAVSWATDASVPIVGQRPNIPPSPVESAPSPIREPVQATPPPAEMQPEPEPPPAPQAAPPPASNGRPTNGLGAIFPDDAIMAFRAEIERAITAGYPAEAFAQGFVDAYPDPSGALVTMYKPENFLDVVKAMPNGAESVILRRDGKKWVDQLWSQISARHQARAGGQQQAPAS